MKLKLEFHFKNTTKIQRKIVSMKPNKLRLILFATLIDQKARTLLTIDSHKSLNALNCAQIDTQMDNPIGLVTKS